jgi:glycine/serine hydroxymethyltransferase
MLQKGFHFLLTEKRFYSNQLFERLAQIDPEMFDIIELEKQRQREGIVLIPSEVFVFKFKERISHQKQYWKL